MRRRKYTEIERFWAKVDKTGDCWNWTAAKKQDGYGLFSLHYTAEAGRRLKHAHRYSWEHFNGPIPEGMFIDHLCHNTSCVNPFHLRMVTRQQNNEHRKGPNVTNRYSGVLGVQPTSSGKWAAIVNHKGKQHHAGYSHLTIAEAEAAVIKLRLELFTHNEKDRLRLNPAAQAVQEVRKATVWNAIADLKASIA